MSAAVDSSLKARIRGALIFGITVISALYLGGAYFAFLMTTAAIIGVYEWMRMVKLEKKKYRLPFMVLGILYICISCGLMAWLRIGTAFGLYNMLTLLLIVWASDISAYFSGRALGGPKLAPKISPKKTWAGFIGSSVGAGAVAAGLACPDLLEKFDVDTVIQMTPLGYGLMGFVLAMFGQAGDLLVSVFKRRYGVKDTGAVIPGHGGVLDRIDALLLVALFFGALVATFS